MHPTKRLFSALLALFMLLLPLSGLAEATAAENLILNPDVDGGDYWTADAWDTSSALSRHEIAGIGYGDNSSLYVENMEANDARYIQTIWVEPDTTYRISCYVMAEACGEENAGANLSILNTFVISDSVYDTDGQWQYLELYGSTGADQTELTVMARVGGYSSTNTGKAWFDHFEMVAVDEIPETALLYDFSTPAAVVADTDDTESDEEPARNTPTLMLISVLFVVLACAGWATIRRINETDRDLRGHAESNIFAAILLVAFVFRLYLAFRYPGYRVDMNCFEAWANRLANIGPINFYDPENYFCDYPPVYLLLLSIVEWIRRLFSIAYDGTLHRVLIRLWPILADLITAQLIYRVGRKHIGDTSAAALGTLHAFSITSMAISAAWGQADSILALLIAVALLLAIEKKWTPALVCYAVAVLTKPQALLFAPIGVTFYVCDIVRSRGKNRGRLLLSAAIAVAAAYLIMLPFSVAQYDGVLAKIASPILFMVDLFSGTTGGYSYMTVNALNLYSLLNLNWAGTAYHPVLYAISWVLMVGGFVYGCWLTAVSKERCNVLLTAATVMSLIFAFGPMMHERYLYPAIVLIMLFYAIKRDRRVLMSAIVCTATLFLNTTLVLQGGMGSGNYGHLQSSEQWLNAIVSLINVLNALYLAYTALHICLHGHTSVHCDRTPDGEPVEGVRLNRRKDARLCLTRRDCLLMGAVTVIYAIVAFVNLGTLSAPQTEWTSSSEGESIVFDLGETKPFRMTYYGGICNTYFTVSLSDDGEVWSEEFDAEYAQGQIFRWLYYVPQIYSGGSFSDAYGESEVIAGAPDTYCTGDELPDALAAFENSNAYPPQQARYIRITAVNSGLKLREIGFLDANGDPLPVEIVSHQATPDIMTDGVVDDAAKLIDEQDTVPAKPSYLNGTYFDEIYHARTGYEHQQGLATYEWTHPPLGKVFIMVGINLFGMTPFGWRFMGTLFGVLMLPVMYLLAKQLTHRTDLSFIAMTLLALDSMHFTQTRIATVDSYAVFFIMLMYLFMFRYQQMNWNHDGLKRTLVPLGLCGISMGLGIACKWIGMYAAVGLAVIFFATLWKRFSEHRYAIRNAARFPADHAAAACARSDFWKNAVITCAFCVLFFIVIPALIYYFSYYWQLQSEGGLNLSRVIQLQESMFSYHSGLGGDTHYFRSDWYEWPIIWWPMWYYSGTGYMPDGVISSISCMGNPAVWWTGLIALLATFYFLAVKKRKPDSYHLVIIGFLSQFLPWVLVPRSTFIYHYFASVPFIILCTVLMLDRIRKRSPKAFKTCAAILLVAALVLFVAFYPLESGMPVARSYAKYLRWFKWYNF